MSANTSNANGGGIGFFGLLAVLFVALKLTGYINWSWVWVLAPLWISAAVAVVLLVVLGLIFAIVLKNSR